MRKNKGEKYTYKEIMSSEIYNLITTNTQPLSENILLSIENELKVENPIKPQEPIPQLSITDNIFVVRGNILNFPGDAIVNPANSQGLGCFQIGHKCLDNQIHYGAGPRLRLACAKILKNKLIPVAGAILTNSFMLPSTYVIHTVGPQMQNGKQNEEKPNFKLLYKTYQNCLELAKSNKIKTIAFPEISTGVFGYPKEESFKVALDAVKSFKFDGKIYMYLYNPK